VNNPHDAKKQVDMRKIIGFLFLTLVLALPHRSEAQQINGQTFRFPNGKTEWSDTVYKKILTKQMAKEGMSSVLIGIRYKLIKSSDEGSLYAIEVTNKSPDSKVKFRVVEKKNQDAYTVSLDPKQTKVFQKLYLRTGTIDAQNIDNANSGYLNQLLDEMDEPRY
jgi:hypothetical protein